MATKSRKLEYEKGLDVAGKVKLNIEGKDFELPVIEGSEKEMAIDITKLRAATNYITLDNGFGNTGSCKSSITFLEGDKGILRYRGYPIEQIAEQSNFIECSYLLFYGDLPTTSQLNKFKNSMKGHPLPKEIKNIIDSFPKKTHPMAVLSSSIAALSAFETNEKSEKVLVQMMDQICAISARFYRNANGKKPINSDSSLSYVENFLYMMFGKKVDKDVSKALDTLLVLHADHEQNCSTSTVRMVGSSKANPFVCISSGINALWGPLHGGANQEVVNMLEEIQKSGGNYKKALTRAKDKNDTFKLMGFGHRVYKNFDPRAKIIKAAADTVLNKLGVKDPLLDLARGLEEEALKDPYFVERKLYPNVDFYSGIIYRALGIPTNMFTVMFAIGRLPGWMSQWKEMVSSTETKIARPRQIYIGPSKRDYKPLKGR
ncbi:MAG: citrate synthase [Bacteriovoracales bacterium]